MAVDLVQNMKKMGKEQTLPKILPACNAQTVADVMMKIAARPGCTRTKGCSLARETNKNKILDPHSGGSLSCQVCVFKLGHIVTSIIMKKNRPVSLVKQEILALFSTGTFLQCSPSAPQNIA